MKPSSPAGEAEDWAKISSRAYSFDDLTTLEMHAYRNIETGQLVELKTKIGARKP